MNTVASFEQARLKRLQKEEEKQRPAEPEVRYRSGLARCIDCGHEWPAVAPVPSSWLECEKCRTMKGRFIEPCTYEGKHLVCKCSNSLMRVTPDFIYCPACGDVLVRTVLNSI